MTAVLSLRARLAVARLRDVESEQAAYRADIAARGVVAVVAPFIPEQRRAS